MLGCSGELLSLLIGKPDNLPNLFEVCEIIIELTFIVVKCSLVVHPVLSISVDQRH